MDDLETNDPNLIHLLQKHANGIAAHDLLFGNLVGQLIHSYQERRFVLALAGLFILAEHGLKRRLDLDEGNFSRAIQLAEKEGILASTEKVLFDQIREWRNKIFHENPYGEAVVFDGLIYQCSEDETHQIMFEYAAPKILFIIDRLLEP